MDKVLITGGSHAELPLIKSLRDMGYYVITTGNNQDGLGHKVADLYEMGDFSDHEFVLELAKKHHVCGIVSGCNDFAYLSTAYAAECMGQKGHDSYEKAKRIHHKDSFRDVLLNCGLPCPIHIKISNKNDLNNAAERIGFPLVLKPIDLTGGKGVMICENIVQLKNAYSEACRCTREEYVITEQLIRGSNHGVSSLIIDGKVAFAFFDNEEYYINKYLVSGAYSCADISQKVRDNIIRQIEVIAIHEGLVDGMFHCQCIVSEGGVPYIIDPCRRAPGDLYINLVEFATGIPYSQLIVKSELGLKFESFQKNLFKKEKCIARECLMTDKNGIYRGYSIIPELKSYVKDKLIWAKSGDTIEDYLKYKAGIVFYEFPDKKIMYEMLSDLYSKMIIDVG